MLSAVKVNRNVGCCRWGQTGSVRAEIGEMFSVRLLCIQTLHKIHMGLLVVQSVLKGSGCHVDVEGLQVMPFILC